MAHLYMIYLVDMVIVHTYLKIAEWIIIEDMIFNGFGCAQGTCKWMPFWLPNMLSKSVLLVFVNSFAIFHVEGTWGNPELS